MGSHTIGSNRSNARRRHATGADTVQRASHGGPFDPTGVVDAVYGGGGPAPSVYIPPLEGEPIGWQDVGQEIIGAGNIQADAVTARTISVGMFGVRNLLSNGGFRNGTTGWTLGGTGTASLSGVWSTSATDYTLRDFDIDGATGTAAPWGSTSYIKNTANTGTLLWYQDVIVTGGSYYSLSALLGNLRATSTYATIEWFTAAAASISTETSNVITVETGGPTRDLWGYAYIEDVQAPTTASKARVSLIMVMPRTSGSDCYMYADQVMFTNSHKALPYVSQEEELVRAAAGSVIIDANGVTIINGALTVASDTGATVIIDGTSNMFKIQASGTLNVTATSSSLNANTVTLTGLGTVTTAPAHLCHVSGASASTSPKYGATYLANISKGYVAATPSGTVNQRTNVADVIGFMSTVITSSQVVVEIDLFNESGSSVTIYGKYYVLVEAAV